MSSSRLRGLTHVCLASEIEPMVASRAASASPTSAFTAGFYGASDASRPGGTAWASRSAGAARAPPSSASSSAAGAFHWSPTPLGGLYASQTPLLAPSGAATALATMSTATSVLSTLPPPTPTPSLPANDSGGSSSAHSWRLSTSLTTWSGPSSGGAHWTVSDEQHPPPQLSPLTRARGFASTSPPGSRLTAQMPPLVLPPPPPALAKPAASRKRRRAPGAQRLRNFLCMHPACGKSFTDSAHLRDHTVVHTGEKRLSCALCDRRFARLSTLHEHQRVHTGEKPYACAAQGCAKRYSSRAALRVHVATHSSAAGGYRRRGVAAPRHDNCATVAGDAEHAAERPEERPELSSHFHGHDRLPASYGHSPGDHQSYETPPIATVDATYMLQTRELTAGTSDQSSDAPDDAPSRSLEDTVREQRDQIAMLQHELERLRQQPQPARRKKPSRRGPVLATSTRRTEREIAAPAAKMAAPMTAPVEFLQDGVKPFTCCICSQRFVNYYQLTFHAKQHAGASLATVVGQSQAPLPVGPKFCPERGCEFSEAAGRSLRSLQTLKRHWQRRHQLDRPHVCAVCPPHQRKTFKTRENLKAHEKDCRRSIAAASAAVVSVST